MLETTKAHGGIRAIAILAHMDLGAGVVPMKTISLRAGLAAIGIFAAVPSFAQHMNAPDAPCRDVGTTAEATNCFYRAAAEQDRKLNADLRRITLTLSTDEQRDLQEVQTLWSKYRDRTCEAERSLFGAGTGGPVTYQACREALARARIKELRASYWWRVEKGLGSGG